MCLLGMTSGSTSNLPENVFQTSTTHLAVISCRHRPSQVSTRYTPSYASMIPTNRLSATTRRIMSLQQPTNKMSKSHPDPRSRVLITDRADDIHKKIMGALTDSVGHVSYDPAARPGVSNLLEIISVFDEQARSPQALAETLKDASLKTVKEMASNVVISGLRGVRERYLEVLSADDGRYLDAVELEGARKAQDSANETMALVREATGL